jgi:hypothetical protein
MTRWKTAWLTIAGLACPVYTPGQDTLTVTLRSRAAKPGDPPVAPTETKAAWDPKKTAVIVCDMWDDHWCRSAAARGK